MSAMTEADLRRAVDDYYSRKIREHGATPRGVDWNGEASQRLRYEQLARLLPARDFSICDLGCGYGGLFDYLAETRSDFRYVGVDLSAAMLTEAERMHRGAQGCRFVHGFQPDSPADFVLASGIFNVRQDAAAPAWEAFVFATIERMHALSTRGFAFNCLTSHADPERQRADLYYGDPATFFTTSMRYCRNVALLHDYGLYEFTVLVRKEVQS